MGKIVDMQKAQEELLKKKLNQRENTNLVEEIQEDIVDSKVDRKPKLKIKSMKDIATLLGPNASKYKLSKNQRNFQLKGRLTIAAIASAIAITGGIAGVNVANNLNNKDAIESYSSLDKEELLDTAESKLLDCILGENRTNDKVININYISSKDDGGTTLVVTSGKDDMQENLFSYSDTLSFDSFLNAKEVNTLIKNMIDVHFSEEPTNKQLQKLNSSIEDMENKNFELKNNHIVVSKEKNDDFEK